MSNLRQEFIAFSVQAGVLKFGEFTTKAGRQSPYFFNAGLFHDGATLAKLADFYAQTLLDSGVEFDMLFGPAYKGITLASATAMALAGKGRNTSFAYNRKEAKDHGEGGTLVGAKLSGKVVIIDDVISAGTSVRESVEMIRNAGAEPCAVLIALEARMARCPNCPLCRKSARITASRWSRSATCPTCSPTCRPTLRLHNTRMRWPPTAASTGWREPDWRPTQRVLDCNCFLTTLNRGK